MVIHPVLIMLMEILALMVLVEISVVVLLLVVMIALLFVVKVLVVVLLMLITEYMEDVLVSLLDVVFLAHVVWVVNIFV